MNNSEIATRLWYLSQLVCIKEEHCSQSCALHFVSPPRIILSTLIVEPDNFTVTSRKFGFESSWILHLQSTIRFNEDCFDHLIRDLIRNGSRCLTIKRKLNFLYTWVSYTRCISEINIVQGYVWSILLRYIKANQISKLFKIEYVSTIHTHVKYLHAYIW